MEDKLFITVWSRPELYDTKVFMDQHRTVKEKTWCKIHQICTTSTFYTRPLPTVGDENAEAKEKKEMKPLSASPV